MKSSPPRTSFPVARTQLSAQLIVAISALAALALTACGRNNGDNPNNDGQAALYAQIPAPTMNQCNPYAWNTSGWGMYKTQTYQPYSKIRTDRGTAAPTNEAREKGRSERAAFVFPQQGLCDCPMGTFPTCGPNGLMCVSVEQQWGPLAVWSYAPTVQGYSFYRAGFWMMSCFGASCYSSGHNTFDPYDQGYLPTNYRRPHRQRRWQARTCYASVAQTCRYPGQVIGGLYCQPVGQGSPFGVWVQKAQ